jgi:competence protein ComEA
MNMLRRNFAVIVVIALLTTMTLAAQVKEMPKTPVKSANAPKSVDINSATPNDIQNLGIDAATAKKIVDGRPYRTKHDLVTRDILTQDQYDKYKAELVARRPGTTSKTSTKKKSN